VSLSKSRTPRRVRPLREHVVVVDVAVAEVAVVMEENVAVVAVWVEVVVVRVIETVVEVAVAVFEVVVMVTSCSRIVVPSAVVTLSVG
jgi:hypothetical protein